MADIRQVEWNNQIVYELSNREKKAFVNPADGMNVFTFIYQNLELISYCRERAEAGVTYGIPILFPTPNRTRDNRFFFEGIEYPAKMHGIARKASFQVLEAKADEKAASIKGSFTVEKGSAFYEEFPFLCTLTVQISLTEDGLQYNYEVENQDEKRLPFGFSLHPFFNKSSDTILICVGAKKVMKKDENFLPTGEIIEVMKTEYDLQNGRQVSELSLDDVYTGLNNQTSAIVTYPDFQLTVGGSEDFTHMVVYTPKQESFFCIEPQTCSTDAINLYEKGEKEASGLIVVEAGEKASGTVCINVVDTFESKLVSS